MTTDHERIDELLCAHVLRSLAPEDAAEAEHLISDHVPGCPICRETLNDLESLTADLALSASPVTPPETLLPRLHHELERADRRRRPVQVFAVAAGVAAVMGLAGLTVTQEVRANNSRAKIQLMSDALNAASKPGANIRQVGPTREIESPGSEVAYLYGVGVPGPPAGREYRIWFVDSEGSATFLGLLGIEEGVAFAKLTFDPSRVVEILITEEPSGSATDAPGQVRWKSAA